MATKKQAETEKLEKACADVLKIYLPVFLFCAIF